MDTKYIEVTLAKLQLELKTAISPSLITKLKKQITQLKRKITIIKKMNKEDRIKYKV